MDHLSKHEILNFKLIRSSN